MKKIISLILIFCMVFVFGACGSSQSGGDSASQELSVTLEVTAINQFGEPELNMTPEEFNHMGFTPGDSLDLTVGDSIALEDIPYFDGVYGKRNSERILVYMGKLMVSAQPTGFANLYEVKEGDKVTISLREKEGQIDIYNTYSMSYSDDPADYDSADTFINARVVETGNIKANTLYRGASPFDNTRGRTAAVSKYLKANGINTILNLSQSEESILEEYDSIPDYAKSMFDENKVICAELSTDYQSQHYSQALAASLIQMSEMDGPYYVHCLEGKDRSGFVCAVLEALCGATSDEIIDDYMLSFENYYGLELGSEKYELMRNEGIVPMLKFIAGDANSDSADPSELKGIDLQKAAETYLSGIGLDQSSIDDLIRSIEN